MGLSDSRQGRCAGYVFPPSVARFRWPPCRASQAPRLIYPRALSPTTPEGPLAACACCFTSGLVWLHPVRRTGPLRFPIEAESGLLALRLACSPPDSPIPSLGPTLARLHAEQAIYMVNSFQFTRSARLILAYRTSESALWACGPPKRMKMDAVCDSLYPVGGVAEIVSALEKSKPPESLIRDAS
jgi:hypothetical protein